MHVNQKSNEMIVMMTLRKIVVGTGENMAVNRSRFFDISQFSSLSFISVIPNEL